MTSMHISAQGSLESSEKDLLVTRRLGFLEVNQHVIAPASDSLVLTEVDLNP